MRAVRKAVGDRGRARGAGPGINKGRNLARPIPGLQGPAGPKISTILKFTFAGSYPPLILG